MSQPSRSRASDDPGPGSQTSLRQANVTRVVETLWLVGTGTQADLSRRTALAPSTVSGIVHDLAEAGLVTVEEGHGGRRGRRVSLAVEGRYLAAIDVGHAHVRVGLATLGRRIVGTRYARLGHQHRHDEVLATARDMMADLRAEHGIDPAAVLAGGLSIPAPVDVATGRVLDRTSVLPGWANADLAAEASDAVGGPVLVDNDANTAAIAEHRWGAAQGLSNVAYLKLGHGVGAGLILDGQVFRGAAGLSGEIGHTIVDDYGTFCRCGNRGCLETVVNASRLVERIVEVRPELDTISAIVDAARAGDPSCVRLLADAGRTTGRAAAALCNLLSPEALVIGGSLSAAGEVLIGPLREAVDRFAMPSAVAQLRIVQARYGPETHLQGALGLGLDALAASLGTAAAGA